MPLQTNLNTYPIFDDYDPKTMNFIVFFLGRRCSTGT